jgi:hypothetical protein
VLGCILLAAAVIALIAGSVIAMIVLLALAVVAFVFFYDAARRTPGDRVASRVFGVGSAPARLDGVRAQVRVGLGARPARPRSSATRVAVSPP